MKWLCVLKRFAIVLVAALLGFSCGDGNNPTGSDGPGEEELITTLKLTLTETVSSTSVTVQFQDLDGPGGVDGSVDTLTVTAGSTYSGVIQVLNEAETPAEDITSEVREEAEEHMFWFTAGGGFSAAATTRTDHESDYVTAQTGTDHEVGITFQLVATSGVTAGTFTVALDHYDDVAKDGTSRSNETDIEVVFPVKVTP